MSNAEDADKESVRIPVAKFIENVGDFLAGKDPDEAIKELQANHQVYKAVEQQLLHKKTRLLSKVPDLKKAIDMVKMLIQKSGDEVTVDYSLSEQVYATARLKSVTSVKLWLGAGVMLDYDLEEAKSLLEENLETAKKQLEINSKDQGIMKDYITTTEVSIARIYNHEVSQRKKPASS